MIFGVLTLFLCLDILTVIHASNGPECSHSYLGRVGQGRITSYNFPFNYRHNLTCTYSIALNIPQEGTKIVCLTFHRFELESSTPFCSFDYLKLDYVNLKYCGSGLWQYGVQTNQANSNVWSRNFCWVVKDTSSFDLTFSSDNNINGPGFYATYSIYDGASSDATHGDGILGQAPCEDEEWTCFNRKCIAQDLLCNGADDCGDGSDESYAHARCGEQNVLACDFSPVGTNSDGYCGFTHEGWFRTNEKHSPYGPHGDHTNGTHGFYVYSDVNHSSAYLLSPELTLPRNRTYCLAFWYYVYGRPPAAVLRVYIEREQAYSRPEWSRRYTEGNEWVRGEVTVRTDVPLQVIFAAELDNSFSGVALDDISVMEGACGGNDISCNFETSTCGWGSVSSLTHFYGKQEADLAWKIHSRLLGANGPFWDHSSRDGGGYYLYLNHSSPKLSNNRALFISPPVAAPKNQYHCLRFYYFMMGMDKDCCQLRVKIHGADSALSDAIWSNHAEIRNVWIAASVQLDISAPYQIVLEGMVNQASRGDIGIDQLILQPGSCPVLTEGACTVGQYLCADGQCINSTQKCDGVRDCADNSDEDWKAGCSTPTPSTTPSTPQGPCPPQHFRCLRDDSCVPNDWLCDSFNDCGDMSDESEAAGCTGSTGEVSAPSPCRPGLYACLGGGCIQESFRCDGKADCKDASDEDNTANCSGNVTPTAACPPSEFMCRSDLLCIPSERVCDGQPDCADNSDEEDSKDGCLKAISATGTGLGTGAIVGIVFGCILCLVMVVISALLGRRRRKPPPRRGGSRSSRPEISTISCTDANGTLDRHMNMLESIRQPMQSGAPCPPPYTERNHENRGFSPDGSTPTTEEAVPSPTTSGIYPPDEPPPPYDAVLKEQMSSIANQAQERVQNNDNIVTEQVSTSTPSSSGPTSPSHSSPSQSSANTNNPSSGRESDSENIYEELSSTLGRPSPSTLNPQQPPPVPPPPHPVGLHSPPIRTIQQPRVRLGTTALHSRMNPRARNYYTASGLSDSERAANPGFQRGGYYRRTGPPAVGTGHLYTPSPHLSQDSRGALQSHSSDDNLPSNNIPQRLNATGRGYRREVPMPQMSSPDQARSRAPIHSLNPMSLPPAPVGTLSPTYGGPIPQGGPTPQGYNPPALGINRGAQRQTAPQSSYHPGVSGQFSPQRTVNPGHMSPNRAQLYQAQAGQMSPNRLQQHPNSVNANSQMPNRNNYERLQHTPGSSQRPTTSYPNTTRDLNTSRGSSDNLSMSDMTGAQNSPNYHSRSGSSNVSYDRASTSPLCGHNDSRSSEEFEILSPTSV